MIKIATRYRPYSVKPGASCLIPGTKLIVKAFPTLIQVFSEGMLHSEKKFDRIDKFVMTQDLEQGYVSISNQLYVDSKGLITDKKPAAIKHDERLSLGISKAQSFCKIRERKNLEEILPLWHKLAGYYNYDNPLLGDLQKLYLSYFDAYFVPRSTDSQHQGLYTAPLNDPYTLFSQKGVRSFVLEETKDLITIKKNSFVSGRLTDAKTSQGIINYEWTKNFPRQLEFVGDISKLEIAFPPEVKRYRVVNTDTGLIFDKFEA